MTNPINSSLIPVTSSSSTSTSIPSISRDDLLRSAIENPFPALLPENTFAQIANLQMVSKHLISETTDPVEFFAPFGVEKADLKLFKPEDIGYLQNLVRSSPISTFLSFHDLFGMEMSRILRNIQPFLKNGSELSQKWEALYYTGYLGIMRQGVVKLGVSSEYNPLIFTSPQSYAKEILKLTLTLKKDLLSSESQPLLQEWVKAQTVLSRFLLSPKVTDLIGSAISQLGSQNKKSDEKTIDSLKKTVLEPLIRYVEGMKNSQSKAKDGKKILQELPDFKVIHEKLVAILNLKNTKAILEAIDKLFHDVNQRSLALRNLSNTAKEDQQNFQDGLLDYDRWIKRFRKVDLIPGIQRGDLYELLILKQTQLNLATSWLFDIQSILEHDLLTQLDPNFSSSQAYMNRVMLNLTQVALMTNQQISFDERDTPLQKNLPSIQMDFIKTLKRNDIVDAGNRLGDIVESYGSAPFDLIHPHLTKLHQALKAPIEKSLQFFESYSGMVEEDLTSKILWFCRILILYHDIGVILKKTSPNGEIIPASFYDFLFRTSEDSDESSPEREEADPLPSESIAPTRENVPFEPEMIVEAELPISVPKKETPASPPPATQKKVRIGRPQVSSSSSSRSVQEPAHPTSHRIDPVKRDHPVKRQEVSSSTSSTKKEEPSHTTSHRIDPDDASEILETRNRRKLKMIFEKLGLKYIGPGKGSHEKWGDEKGQISTTLPGPGEIARGTLNSIYKDVTGQKDHKFKPK